MASAAWRLRRFRREVQDAAEDGGLAPFKMVFSSDNLLRTLNGLRHAAGPAPGPDRLTYTDLSRREAASLCRAVSQSILAGVYQPGPERLVDIPKRSGGTRTLRLRSILDRVVAAALVEALTPLIEARFLPCSYGYRRGRNVLHLLADLDAAMTAHDAWIVTVEDVRKAFDSVKIDSIVADFKRVIGDDRYFNLIGATLRGADANRKEAICQGCPFSPIALNLHLHHVHDLAIAHEVIPFAGRYADNIVYLTADASEGHQVLRRTADRLKAAGLSLKGPGIPIDLREGGSVVLLGLTVRHQNGAIRYTLAEGALTNLAVNLAEAHMAYDPPQAARMAVLGWVGAMGPTLEGNAATTAPGILTLLADHGLRGLLRKREIMEAWEAGHQAWRAIRRMALRNAAKGQGVNGAKGEGDGGSARLQSRLRPQVASRGWARD
jgi:hypothetical protein